MGLTDISRHAEIVEQFIKDLAVSFRKKKWVKLLSLASVIFAVLLNPSAVEYGLGFLSLKKPEKYSYVIWIIITALLFVAAFLVALLTKEKEQSEPPPSKSIIKGLLSYTNTKEDAEWFARLQRGNILQECLRFCEGKDYSFGILSGESGSGKTSLLQAGLLPALERQNYHAVYVKFTDSSPLDSIRQSFNGAADTPPPAESQNLLALLEESVHKDSRPLILIFDQFEQFFVHHKTKVKRKPFIEQMAEWYKQGKSLPVTILISIRGDFASLMNEFQSKMDYTLTLHNNLSVEKFEPHEATKVISVIAEEARIKFDEAFINDLTEDELADSEDGTVSPVDIQILSWMLDGQKYSEERAFNRKAFQKLGGVEGLLERFLERTLKARVTKTQRESAISVMLALTEQNTRTGALSVKDLKEKLKEIPIHEADVEEAALWLSRSDVRLVTPFLEKDTTLYELAHERIIPSLIRLASKEITDVEKAEQMLDRRVNEWLGNNRSRSYLLTFGEWRLIRRYWTLFKSNKQKEQKESFLSLSRKRFIILAAICSTVLLVTTAGYISYQWYENQRETQLFRASTQLEQLRARKQDAKYLQNAKLLDYVFEASEIALSEDLDVLIATANSYIKLENSDAKTYTKTGNNKIVEVLDKSRDRYSMRPEKLVSIADLYVKLGKPDIALDCLDEVMKWSAIADNENKEIWASTAEVLSSITSNSKNLAGNETTTPKLLKTVKVLSETLAKADYSTRRISILMAKIYLSLKMAKESIKHLKDARKPNSGLSIVGVQEINRALKLRGRTAIGRSAIINYDWKNYDLIQPYPYINNRLLKQNTFQEETKTLISDAESHLKAGKNNEALSSLNEAILRTEFIMTFPLTAVEVAESYIIIGRNDEALNSLNEVVQNLKKNPSRWASAFISAADTYIKLGKNDDALNSLNEAMLEIDRYSSNTARLEKEESDNSQPQDSPANLPGLYYGRPLSEILLSIAKNYKKLGKNEEALNCLNMIKLSIELSSVEVWKSVIETYMELGKNDKALEVLNQGQSLFTLEGEKIKNPALVEFAVLYAKLDNWRKAVETVQSINIEGYQIMALSRVLAYSKSPEKFNLIEDMFWDNESEQQ